MTFAVIEPDIERAVAAGADQFELAGEIIAERVRCHRISGVAAAVIHQLDEIRPAFGDVVGHAPEPAKRAVDELHIARGIQHDNAVIEIVDDGAQRGKLRGRIRTRPIRRFGFPCGIAAQGVGTGAHNAFTRSMPLQLNRCMQSVILRCERSEPRRMHGPGRRPSRAASRPPQDDGSLVPNRCAVRQISNVHVSRCFYICAGALFAASHGRQLMRCTGRPENALTPPPVMTKPHFW